MVEHPKVSREQARRSRRRELRSAVLCSSCAFSPVQGWNERPYYIHVMPVGQADIVFRYRFTTLKSVCDRRGSNRGEHRNLGHRNRNEHIHNHGNGGQSSEQPNEDQHTGRDFPDRDQVVRKSGAGRPIVENRRAPRSAGKRSVCMPSARNTPPTIKRMSRTDLGAPVVSRVLMLSVQWTTT